MEDYRSNEQRDEDSKSGKVVGFVIFIVGLALCGILYSLLVSIGVF